MPVLSTASWTISLKESEACPVEDRRTGLAFNLTVPFQSKSSGDTQREAKDEKQWNPLGQRITATNGQEQPITTQNHHFRTSEWCLFSYE